MNNNQEHNADYQAPESAEEILRRYAAGERYFAHADLPDGAVFRSANLEDCTFDHSFLSDADFREANLKGVSFLNSNIKCSDFRGANLQGASFQGSSVEAIFLDGANLDEVSFAGATWCGATLKEGDFPP